MLDPNFAQSVVYLISHGAEGAFGLVLNRPAPILLEEVAEELGLSQRLKSPIYFGGPVERNRGFVLHPRRDLLATSEEVEEGIFLSGSPETLKILVESGDPFKFFLGYSGWAPHQLEEEISHGSWLVLPSRKELILNPRVEQLWERVLREVGIEPGMIATGGGQEIN
jgi:putative transcriptional regulator